MKRTCNNCKHYGLNENDNSECRRYPPLHLIETVESYGYSKDQGVIRYQGLNYKMIPCGEHKYRSLIGELLSCLRRKIK